MNREECAKLLTLIEQIDHRKWDQTTVVVWLGLVGDLQFADAVEAVRLHFRSSPEYLTPQHIRAGVDAIRTERYETELALAAAPVVADVDVIDGEPRGTRIFRFVADGLRRARAAAGGRLGRERSAARGENLVRDALRRWPATVTPSTRGEHCGRGGCRCTHDLDPDTGARCDAGWVEVLDAPAPEPTLDGAPGIHRDTAQVGMVRKCPTCDQDGAERVTAAVSRHHLGTVDVDPRTVAAARSAVQKSLRSRKRGK